MKMQCLGIKRMAGIAKSGNEFDFTQVIVQSPVERVSNSKIQIEGSGFEVATIDAHKDCLKKFAAFPFPCMVDFQVDQEFMQGRLRTVITGGTVVAAPVQQVNVGR